MTDPATQQALDFANSELEKLHVIRNSFKLEDERTAFIPMTLKNYTQYRNRAIGPIEVGPDCTAVPDHHLN